MVQREIQIFMKIPDISQPFGIYTSSYDVGRVGDSGATSFIFNRPDNYINNNLRIILSFKYNDKPIIIDLGYDNKLTLTANLTSETSFMMQVAFTDSDNIITISNKLTFYLTSSITPDVSEITPDYLQELLQFAISQKQNKMQIETTIDPRDSTSITYKLIAFNNSGDKISEVVLPINSYPDASSVKYDNTLIEGNILNSKFTQGAIDELVNKIKELESKISELESKINNTQ